MAKKVIKEMDLNDMIVGGHSSDTYPEYHRQILSGLLSEDSERTEKQYPASSAKPEQETGEHCKESTETPCFAFGKGKIIPVGHNFKESQMENTTSKTGG